MHYLLAVDQGTSSTRAMLYTTKGHLVTKSHYPLTQYYPHIGWVEHDPEEIWQKTLHAMRDVILSVESKHIVTFGLTNQRETTLIWDKKTGQCLTRAIVWQDRRTEEFCASLSSFATMIHQKTGLQIDPYFSASKLHWLLKNIPDASRLAKNNRLAFGTVDSFLIWRLTKGKSHLTDITNASRTLLYNINQLCWDDEMLHLFSIPKQILPDVYASDAYFGDICTDFLGVSIPITGVAGDQQASLIGQGCFDDGMIKATFGTGGFLMLNTGSKLVMSKHRLLSTIAYQIQGKTVYGLEGGLYQAGSIVKWLRDELKLFRLASDTEKLANSLKSNEGVYLVPSFTGLGAPHWLSRSGAVIMGLSRTSNRAHLARAALESVCYQTCDVLYCMREDSAKPLKLCRVDGGMATNSWFLQFLSSLCDLNVQCLKNVETTVFGAAMLAALGAGVVGSLNALQRLWSYEKEYVPEKNHNEMKNNYAGWQQALHMVTLV